MNKIKEKEIDGDSVTGQNSIINVSMAILDSMLKKMGGGLV